MDDKKSLLMRIMTCDFILTETALFLDSHPNCADARVHKAEFAAIWSDFFFLPAKKFILFRKSVLQNEILSL